MRIGTKSILFGAHQFALHPWFVAAAWWQLYGFPWDPRLWVAFFVHDLGYLGKPNMDGPEGETHPYLGAIVMYTLFDWPASSRRWMEFCLFHSRYLAKSKGRPFSRLCVADKLAIALTPGWLYLPMVRLTGEADEYMNRESRQASKNWTPERSDMRRWYTNVRAWCRSWAYEHRDGRDDTWTPSQPRVAVGQVVPGRDARLDERE